MHVAVKVALPCAGGAARRAASVMLPPAVAPMPKWSPNPRASSNFALLDVRAVTSHP